MLVICEYAIAYAIAYFGKKCKSHTFRHFQNHICGKYAAYAKIRIYGADFRICDRIFQHFVRRLAPKCMAFGKNFQKFSGERAQSPPQTQSPTLPPPYSKFLDPPLLVRFPTHRPSMHRLVTYCVVLDFLVL